MAREIKTQSFITCKQDGIEELFKSNELIFFVYPKPITKVYVPKPKEGRECCCCNRCFDIRYLMLILKCMF